MASKITEPEPFKFGYTSHCPICHKLLMKGWEICPPSIPIPQLGPSPKEFTQKVTFCVPIKERMYTIINYVKKPFHDNRMVYRIKMVPRARHRILYSETRFCSRAHAKVGLFNTLLAKK